HRVEVRDQQHAAMSGSIAARPAQQIDMDPLHDLPGNPKAGVLPERLQEVGRLLRTVRRHGIRGDQPVRQLEESFREHRHHRMPSFSAMEQPKAMPFVMDMKEIQRRAREHVEKGAVTPAYRGDLETAIKLLNEALATEIICVLRYRRHHFMAAGLHYQAIADDFLEHSV